MKLIAVLRGRNGSHAGPANLSFAGYKGNLFEFPQFKSNIRKVLETQEIVKEGVGATGVSKLDWVTTDIEAAINNPNPVVHPATTLLGATRIEYSKGNFYSYAGRMTPSVARIFGALAREKITICDDMGWTIYHWDDLDPKGYNLGNTVEECNKKILNISTDCAFGKDRIQAGMKMKGPKNMKDRFITEEGVNRGSDILVRFQKMRVSKYFPIW